eukprot:3152949-Lingulodinium_polyedra.AAC.1
MLLLDVRTIEISFKVSARPGAMGPRESEGGWLGREYLLIINDCMNSGSNIKQHPVKNQADIRKMCDHYD